jgi:AraC-like DNA-binding protein
MYMPGSSVRTFSDPDAYAAAIRQSAVKLTVTGRGHFTARLTRIDLHRLWMQRFSESLPRITHTDSRGGRAVFSFPTQPGPGLCWGGVDLRPGDIMRHDVGGSSHQRASGAIGFAGMSLPLADMASVGETIAGCDLTPPRNALVVTPRPAAMAKLQRLHAAAEHLAETAPELIAHPEAARGLEQSLIEALAGCLAETNVNEHTLAQRRHEQIMRGFHRIVEESLDTALYVPEICAAIGVSARTLQLCCQEQLGMGPKQYLILRRLNLARRDLRKAATDETTVTEIATAYGFWDFGRFAGYYKSVFGEKPSDTLHRV